ncbi:uncharacterized protein TRIADDRAFT_58489 [Trichoplax adhaerens]|uniref:C2 domain-containing protein n=1 Tax=Trichoplax adhaerens TaxID=10228 RepID=B3S2U9_TRIAD|nr:hypothetical protein TRIADDRAFT_58489 [Trichoplax adhaerens]EDV22851.1 hypothetical protein TRIADDRAFT_58489 [Trichoplax adhaerens]|eukprot:XP_002114717.1 hypothetical protein TRIADDRAFT_58489 [Trichoplax adhaerens]
MLVSYGLDVGEKQKTKVIKNDLNPEWNETLNFDLGGKPLTKADSLKVHVKDWERLQRNRLLGQVSIPLFELVKRKSRDVNLAMQDPKGNPMEATISLSLEYNGPPSSKSESGKGGNSEGDAANDAGGVGEEGDEEQEINEEGDGDAEEDEENQEGDAAPRGTGGVARSRKRRKNRRKLSKKPQDFQVRIKVIEGRRLVGSNIKPVVRVNVADQSQQTKVKKRTNKPYFDETFFYNFHLSPMELFDEIIVFQAFTAHKYRYNSLLGSFKIDIGTVYEEEEHAFINKWILLTDPDDGSAGVKGYLKICAMVLAAGDEAPNIPTNFPDEDDMEANLLQPAGIQLRSATFALKVYRAEDLPRMDVGFLQGIKKVFGSDDQKELVDPYFKFSYAGRKAKTRVEYSCDNPEWNQELRLKIRLPSMCERLKLSMIDWDNAGRNDSIGTYFMNISSISSNNEEGFPPTFGPCYINFYGSPREFTSIDEHEDLNDGKGEGCAYRGRALIELSTNVDDENDASVTEVTEEDCDKIKLFMRTRKFALHAAFHEATMIKEKDCPIEFEVSIGNNGNKLDDRVPTSSSTTPPTNAIFDGNYYYYLPWNKRGKSGSYTFKHKKADDRRRNYIRNYFYDQHLKNRSKAYLKNAVQELELLNPLTVTDAVEEIENFVQRLKDIAYEPQISIPDVVIWMLYGEKRVAYYRIPAHEILHSSNFDPDATGKYCGKIQTINLKYPGKKADKKWNIPCQLRVQLWLGFAKENAKWTDMLSNQGDPSIFAETYENQHNIAVWTTKGLSRPKYSDDKGELYLEKENFIEPEGWVFETDWFMSPETSNQYEKDTGRKFYLEDMFENECRTIPGGKWYAPKEPWTNEAKQKVPGKEEVVLPKGWVWESDWQIDYDRAVDEDGWEYTLGSGYVPVEKNYHLERRRRWVRKRRLKDASAAKKKKPKSTSSEGWQYATSFSSKFHPKSSMTDFVRRRRWIRKLKAVKPKGPPVFVFSDEKHKTEYTLAPRMSLDVKKSHKFQLRAYIYQARDLIAADRSGLSDPYARVTFGNLSQETQTIEKTLCPTWDQTLIYDEIEIFGSRDDIIANPYQITIEIFDSDDFGKPEFIGRCNAIPMIKWKSNESRTPKLAWYQIIQNNCNAGELLAAFELLLIDGGDLPFAPPKKKDSELYIVPSGIRPVLRRTAIEIALCWGVRNLKRFRLLPVNSPSIELDVGGYIQKTPKIKSVRKNPNFDNPIIFFDVMLPKEEIYRPPLNIKVIDHRAFGNKPLVGVHVINDISKYDYDPTASQNALQAGEIGSTSNGGINNTGHDMIAIEIQDEKKDEDKNKQDEEEIDWWSKYYASTGDPKDLQRATDYISKGYDKLKIFKTELEEVEIYNNFEDFVQLFPIYRGKAKKKGEDDEGELVGEFKGTFRVYPLPSDPSEPLPSKVFDPERLPKTKGLQCIVRVYVIKAIDLAPKDQNGASDPYCVIKIGKEKINDRDNYIPNTINPVFGRMFELTCTLPQQKDLKISIMDWDMISKDDLIGETSIDLENRYLTKHNALCGLPETYCTSGVNQWRDARLPKDILIKWCEDHGLPSPRFTSNAQVILNGEIYNLADFETDMKKHKHLGEPEQRLALHVLRKQAEIVPEHVETRSLFNPLTPGVEQGKLQMWVDIFPKCDGPPGPPFDITPRKPKDYELRVIIYNTSDVILDETSLLGEKMSDIYVKGWIRGVDEKLKTDVHYRSLNGEGNFNWRFIFPFQYLPGEKSIVIKKKRMIRIESKYKELCDSLSPLCYFLRLLILVIIVISYAQKCTLDQLPGRGGKGKDLVSIFEMKQMQGWWPVVKSEAENPEITGKVEMSIEILTSEEAAAKPAGVGRSDPNANPHLDPPKVLWPDVLLVQVNNNRGLFRKGFITV